MTTRLKKLQARNVPTLAWTDVLTEPESSSLSAEDRAALTIYFAQFATVQRDADGHQLCLGCDRRVLGGIDAALLSGGPRNTRLEWGLVNGEAFCARCRWPYRVYHRNIGGDLITFLSLGLPYHPSQCVVEASNAGAVEIK